MPPGPAEPAAARSFATTASTRNGSSPTISAPSSSIALLRVPVGAPLVGRQGNDLGANTGYLHGRILWVRNSKSCIPRCAREADCRAGERHIGDAALAAVTL